MNNFVGWEKKLYEAFQITMYGCDDDEKYQKASDDFTMLLDEALSANSSEYAEAIMKLFCDDEDYGTLESCFRILSNMDKKEVTEAFMKCKSELEQKSEFWYDQVLACVQ